MGWSPRLLNTPTQIYQHLQLSVSLYISISIHIDIFGLFQKQSKRNMKTTRCSMLVFFPLSATNEGKDILRKKFVSSISTYLFHHQVLYIFDMLQRLQTDGHPKPYHKPNAKLHGFEIWIGKAFGTIPTLLPYQLVQRLLK